jgi:hypothetical protein
MTERQLAFSMIMMDLSSTFGNLFTNRTENYQRSSPVVSHLWTRTKDPLAARSKVCFADPAWHTGSLLPFPTGTLKPPFFICSAILF